MSAVGSWRIRKVGKEYWAQMCIYEADPLEPREDAWAAPAFMSRDQNEVDQYIQDMITPNIVKEYP